jgi:hypothetical protein
VQGLGDRDRAGQSGERLGALSALLVDRRGWSAMEACWRMGRQRQGPLRILVRVTWFPGLRRAGAVRRLRVTADTQRMMEWLTDSGRREREWRRRVEERADIRDPHADRLPDGGLRYRYEWLDGRRVWRFTVEDVAVTGNTIERFHRGQLAGRRAVPVRWVITERICVEPAVNGADVTVRALGRMEGPSRLLHLLGHRDTMTARRLAELARLQADQTGSAIAAYFARRPGPVEAADSAG